MSWAPPEHSWSDAHLRNVSVLCSELLATYVIEALPRDERWRALDVVLALAQRCGDVSTARRVLAGALGLASLLVGLLRTQGQPPARSPRAP